MLFRCEIKSNTYYTIQMQFLRINFDITIRGGKKSSVLQSNFKIDFSFYCSNTISS